jgi:hypothetical protein
MANRVLNVFRFTGGGYERQNDFKIAGAPTDCDWSRWAMVHSTSTSQGGKIYRLYCFKAGTNDTIYQFGYKDGEYHYGYESSPVLKIRNKPATANTNTFSMLHDGTSYRMYFLDVNDEKLLHQFVFDGSNYVPEPSNPTIKLTNLPVDVDLRRTSMLYSSSNNQPGYHFYSFIQGKRNRLLQTIYNPSTNSYERVNDIGIKVDLNHSDISSFSMLNDSEGEYWCYFLNWLD